MELKFLTKYRTMELELRVALVSNRLLSNSLPMVPNRLPMVNMVSSKRAMASRLAMVSMVPKTGLFMATIASNSQVILAP